MLSYRKKLLTNTQKTMAMMNKNFAVFILTHGRPNKVVTYQSLLKAGYTGKVYIVIDNEDKTADEYFKKFGDNVIQFDKKAISDTFDEGDNFEDRRAIIYARNACFDIAKKVGVRYFMELDDDYTAFDYRFNANMEYSIKPIKKIDKVFDILLNYYKSISAKSIAMAQGGDFIGGRDNSYIRKSIYPRRKCMNTFICDVFNPFQFVGKINEDVNTYTRLASTGALFLQIPNVSITQLTTQKNSGGMTDLYLDSGTYIKSFYSVIYQPSSVKIKLMGDTHYRLHHSVSWKNTVPKIISEDLKK